MLVEKEVKGYSGWLMLFLLFATLLAAIAMFVRSAADKDVPQILSWVAVILVVFLCFGGLTVVNPNQARVILLFGKYQGSLKQQGFWWVNPLTRRRTVSLRIRNFESNTLKVNDQDGNPIDIAAVVVWKVVDTAEAMFQVDDYERFVHVQSESA